MEFKEALTIILNIEDYSSSIINSNSNGELFHLQDYIVLAKFMQEHEDIKLIFRQWFEYIVNWAKKEWSRPASIYQHILFNIS